MERERQYGKQIKVGPCKWRNQRHSFVAPYGYSYKHKCFICHVEVEQDLKLCKVCETGLCVTLEHIEPCVVQFSAVCNICEE